MPARTPRCACQANMIYRPEGNQGHTSVFSAPKLMGKLDLSCWKTHCRKQKADRQWLCSSVSFKRNIGRALRRDKQIILWCWEQLHLCVHCAGMHILVCLVFLNHAHLHILTLFTVEPLENSGGSQHLAIHHFHSCHTLLECVRCIVASTDPAMWQHLVMDAFTVCQIGTKSIVYLHNHCTARGNFISALTFGLSGSDTLPQPASRPVSLTWPLEAQGRISLVACCLQQNIPTIPLPEIVLLIIKALSFYICHSADLYRELGAPAVVTRSHDW